MIELKDNQLVFSFPEVHPEARVSIEFQRTLRIPDDDDTYPLPPGLGRFPLQHVDDHAARVPGLWLQHGGIMLPMYQSEAMWLNFTANFDLERGASYPMAIKVATGKQCAVTGKTWMEGLHRGPQNYLVSPEQPWLDGYVVERGTIRQFVAMPLGAGYTAEEQITGAAEHGGLQVAVYPMKREVFERRYPKRRHWRARRLAEDSDACESAVALFCPTAAMGLAPGGRMRQEIYDDPFQVSDWDDSTTSRCFVHLANSLVWQSITGSPPPHPAPTAELYTSRGLPWFDYYNDGASAVPGAPGLAQLKSVAQMSADKGDAALPENESVTPENVVVYRKHLRKGQVREGAF